MGEACVWSQDGEDSNTWATKCGKYFEVLEDTPEKNGFKFCAYCGNSLDQEEWSDA